MKIIKFPIFLFAIYLSFGFDMLAPTKINNSLRISNHDGCQAISAYGYKSIQRPISVWNCPTPKVWKRVFEDDFNTIGSFDTAKWSYCPRINAAWGKYLTATPDYVSLDGSNLNLKMDDKVIDGDAVPYHSGGIETQGKFSFLYGKVEVRARFTKGAGSWPAIWMMPEKPHSYGGWPKSGEIDIMEHVNNETIVHQTIHNGAVTKPGGASSATNAWTYNASDFNTYGIIWTAQKIEFYINGKYIYQYSKPTNATIAQWPFDKPFYLILNQSGGAGWPGPIVNGNLPFSMQVDWVRVYQY